MASFDPLDPAVALDPVPVWNRLRTEGPVVRWEEADGWLVLGHAAARAALSDADRFTVSRWAHKDYVAPDPDRLTPLERIERGGLFHVDRADHTRLRRLVSRAFTPASIERLAVPTRARVDERLDELGSRFDLAADFASTFPVEVIGDYLGLESDDVDRFAPLATAVIAATNPLVSPEDLAAANQAVDTLDRFFTEQFERRRGRSHDDLLGRLVEAEEDGDRLDAVELLSLVIGLLLAGAETTANLIGLGVNTLAAHPDALSRLRTDPSLIPAAIEELLRFGYIGFGQFRFARTDTELGGKSLGRGDLVMVAIGAAMHDPEVFDHPERFDLARPSNNNLSFGIGAHYCLGAALARMEARVVIEALLDRGEALTVTDPIRIAPHFLLRSVESLGVELD